MSFASLVRSLAKDENIQLLQESSTSAQFSLRLKKQDIKVYFKEIRRGDSAGDCFLEMFSPGIQWKGGGMSGDWGFKFLKINGSNSSPAKVAMQDVASFFATQEAGESWYLGAISCIPVGCATVSLVKDLFAEVARMSKTIQPKELC